MKNYYSILDVPTTATIDEIRGQYKQLVRIYHPDRFKNSSDKTYAEQKLREIIEAYNILTEAEHSKAQPKHRTPNSHGRISPPKPVLSHNVLDFGTLKPGVKKVKTVQVGNAGGNANQLSFTYSDDDAWFVVSRGKRVYEDKPIPMLVDLAVDTRKLQPGGTYEGWVQVNMDDAWTRIALRVHVTEVTSRFPFAQRMMLALILLIAISLGSVLPNLGRASATEQSLLSSITGLWSSPASVSALGPSADQLAFSVNENGQDVIYLARPDGSAQQSLQVVGASPTWSPDGSGLAFIAKRGQIPQLHLLRLNSKNPAQLTASQYPKSEPAWSPDGKRIAFLSGTEPRRALEVVDITAMRAQRLTDPDVSDISSVSWSPNGEQLAVAMTQEGKQRLFSMTDNGDGLEMLTDFESWDPDWSPDGRLLVFGSPQGVYTIDLKNRLTQLTDMPAYRPTWSVDGSRIAFLSESTTFKHNEQSLTLRIIDANGAASWSLSTADCLSYAWSPIEDSIACVTGNAKSTASTLYLWLYDVADSGVSEGAVVAEISRPHVSWVR